MPIPPFAKPPKTKPSHARQTLTITHTLTGVSSYFRQHSPRGQRDLCRRPFHPFAANHKRTFRTPSLRLPKTEISGKLQDNDFLKQGYRTRRTNEPDSKISLRRRFRVLVS